MAKIENGNNTAGEANVNSQYELLISPTKIAANAGYIIPLAENDDGTNNAGVKKLGKLITTDMGSLRVAEETCLYYYKFNTAAQDFSHWRQAATTMVPAYSVSGILLNSTALGTTGIGANISSYHHFQLVDNEPLEISCNFQITQPLLANQEYTMGWHPTTGAGVSDPTEGVYFRVTSAGLRGYTNFNGVEISTGVLQASFNVNQTYEICMHIYPNKVLFFVDGKLATDGELLSANANFAHTGSESYPVNFMARNIGVVSGTIGTLRALAVTVRQLESATFMSWVDKQAYTGKNAAQGIKGQTQGSTSGIANNAAPGAGAALTNTTAVAATLGGQISILPTLAANTDGILCSYVVPVGTINLTAQTLLVYGVSIRGLVTTVLVGAPIFYMIQLAYGHTAVSMATADGANTRAARRLFLGYDFYTAAAAAGTLGQNLDVEFEVPIAVQPGCIIAILLKNFGTVTTSGVITYGVRFDAIWV